MSGPLNRQPLGLLSFFDLKSAGGRYPTELGEAIIPTLEMREWMRAAATEVFQGNITVTGPGSFAFNDATPVNIVVPATEIWYVDRYTITTNTVAPDQGISIVPIVRVGTAAGAIGDFAVGPWAFTKLASTRDTNAGVTTGASEPFIAQPGTGFRVRVEEFDGGASPDPGVTAFFKILRLRA